MANDGKIYIIITDQRPGGNQSGGSGSTVINNNTTTNQNQSSNMVSSYVAHKFYDFMIQEVKQIINYQLNNYGNFTGDYQTQRHINSARQGLNFGLGLGGAVATGAMQAGPIGAATAAIVYIGSYTINTVLDYNLNMLENRKTNYEISQLRDRVGLNVLKDGSRGTEN